MQKPPQKHYVVGFLPILFMAAGLTIWNNGGLNAKGTADYVMLGLFILLMIWLLSPRRPDKSAGHDRSSE